MKFSIFAKAFALILGLWAAVTIVRVFTQSEMATAKNFAKQIEQSHFQKSLTENTEFPESERKLREDHLKKLAGTLNKMDFQEREKLRLNRDDMRFFDRLTGSEKKLWIDLTIKESMEKMMVALDAMPESQRREFVEKGIAELEKGLSKEDLQRFRDTDPQLVEKITKEGLGAFYSKAGAATKMDLVPLMESMNEVLQGLRGSEFGPQ